MNNYLSRKISHMQLFAIFSVVVWHSYLIIEIHSDYNNLLQIQNFFSGTIARFSVPVLFTISGYLLFFKKFDYLLALKKRFFSLLVPYIIWSLSISILYQLFLNRLEHLNSIIAVSNFMFESILNPIQYQFWFLRDLMVLILFSPLIFKLIIIFDKYLIYLLFIIWILIGEASYFIRVESLLFFSTGCFLSIKKIDFKKFKLKKINLIFIIIFWVLLSIYVSVLWQDIKLVNFTYFSFLLCISKILGVLIIWNLYDFIAEKLKITSNLLLNSSFFIYAFHEPLLTIFKKLSLNFDNELVLILIYFINPIIVILISFFLFKFLYIFFPRLLYFINRFKQI